MADEESKDDLAGGMPPHARLQNANEDTKIDAIRHIFVRVLTNCLYQVTKCASDGTRDSAQTKKAGPQASFCL
jgi:hypothetical protein